MRLSDAANQLQQLIAEVGDKELEVSCDDENGGSYCAPPEFWFDGSNTVVVREALPPREATVYCVLTKQMELFASLSRTEAQDYRECEDRDDEKVWIQEVTFPSLEEAQKALGSRKRISAEQATA